MSCEQEIRSFFVETCAFCTFISILSFPDEVVQPCWLLNGAWKPQIMENYLKKKRACIESCFSTSWSHLAIELYFAGFKNWIAKTLLVAIFRIAFFKMSPEFSPQSNPKTRQEAFHQENIY